MVSVGVSHYVGLSSCASLNFAALHVGVQHKSGLFAVLCASLNNAAKCQLLLNYLLPGTL